MTNDKELSVTKSAKNYMNNEQCGHGITRCH